MANLVHHQQRDYALLQAIAGVDDPQDGSITIVEDYFTNERMTNRRESGHEVPEDYQPTTRCEYETRVWRNDFQMEEVEQARHPLIKEWDSTLSDPTDEDYEDYVEEPDTFCVEVV